MSKEAQRYLSNAKETLAKSPIVGNRYADVKYVKSACGIAYLSVLKAIDDYLVKSGVPEKDLPKKVEEYRKALRKHVSPYNGKLLDEFNDIYDELHVAGYYRGMLHFVETVKSSMKTAKGFIGKLG